MKLAFAKRLLNGLKSHSSIWVLSFAFLSLASVCLGTPSKTVSQKIDYLKANRVFQEVLNSVIINDDMVDYAFPKFDEKWSDLSRHRVKYDVKGSLKNVPWDTKTVSALATVKLSVNPKDDFEFTHSALPLQDSISYACATSVNSSTPTWGCTPEGTPLKVKGYFGEVSGKLKVTTDTLLMIRYSAEVILKKLDGIEPQYEERLKAHLKRLQVVRSISDAYGLLYSLRKMSLDVIQDEFDSWNKKQTCFQDVSCFRKYSEYHEYLYQHDPKKFEEQRRLSQAWTKDDIENGQRLKSGYDKVVMNLHFDQQGSETIAFEIGEEALDAASMPGFPKPQAAKNLKVKLEISSKEVTSEFESWASVEQKEYLKLKEKLQKSLVNLQNEVREGLINLKKIIHGEPI